MMFLPGQMAAAYEKEEGMQNVTPLVAAAHGPPGVSNKIMPQRHKNNFFEEEEPPTIDQLEHIANDEEEDYG